MFLGRNIVDGFSLSLRVFGFLRATIRRSNVIVFVLSIPGMPVARPGEVYVSSLLSFVALVSVFVLLNVASND